MTRHACFTLFCTLLLTLALTPGCSDTLLAPDGADAVGESAAKRGGARSNSRKGNPGTIAFVSNRTGNSEIFTMRADGTGVTQVTSDADADFSPAWSPDGKRIAFVSQRTGQEEIFTIDADGSNTVQLTFNGLFEELGPAWAPKGINSGRIAFTSNRNGGQEIFTMNDDGSGVTQVTFDLAATNPAWSPDGKRIAFGAPFALPESEIYTMNADGTGLTRLTFNDDGDSSPSWSPDGKRIAFVSRRTGNAEIFTMNADGTGLTQLTLNDDGDSSPSWSPDGKRIAFSSDRSGDFEIYTMKADGTDVTQLTFEGGRLPDWTK